MKALSLVALVAVVGRVAADVTLTCNYLTNYFPDKVVLPNSQQYNDINNDYYDVGSIKKPACIFLPTTAQEVSIGLLAVTLGRIKFAIKSGGHMPGGFNNIGPEGVLIAMEKMKQLEWADNDVLQVGPGNRWGPVYNKAAERGRVVVGGRRTDVGVPGLVIGGGLSFISGEYGFACDNIVGFEVVLGDGRIVYATDSGWYKDLFKALRGGSGNFGIVTRIDFVTYSLPSGWGSIGYLDFNAVPTARAQFIEATANYVVSGATSDSKTGAIAMLLSSPGANINSGLANLWKSEPQEGVPAVFQDITAIPGQHITANMPLHTYITALDAFNSSPMPLQNVFRTATYRANKEFIKKFVEIYDEEFAKIASEVVGITTAILFQPVTANHIIVGNSKRGGNVLGLDTRANQGPFFITEQSVTWALAEDRAKIQVAQKAVDRRTMELGKSMGLYDPYVYVNDADTDQAPAVFPGYGTTNLAFLKRTQRLFDIFGTFRDLMPGGFKLE